MSVIKCVRAVAAEFFSKLLTNIHINEMCPQSASQKRTSLRCVRKHLSHKHTSARCVREQIVAVIGIMRSHYDGTSYTSTIESNDLSQSVASMPRVDSISSSPAEIVFHHCRGVPTSGTSSKLVAPSTRVSVSVESLPASRSRPEFIRIVQCFFELRVQAQWISEGFATQTGIQPKSHAPASVGDIRCLPFDCC